MRQTQNPRFAMALVLAFSALAMAEQGGPVGKSFQECYDAALKRAVTVASQKELIKQAEDNYKQAIGAVLPNISGVGAYQWQQNTSAGGFSTIYPNPSSNTRLTLNQPLFQGFKEFAGFSQTKTLIQASRFDRKQAAVQLYQDLAASYFAVLAYEKDIVNVNEELSFYEERIKETHQFYEIGRSQLTDELTTASQGAALRAQLQQIKGALRAQRAVLAFLTGFDNDVPLRAPAFEVQQGRTLETYLSRLQSRPDVQADSARRDASEEGIPIARAGHFPTLGLTGDYYLERTGALKDVNWDVMLSLTVPIFSGGIVQAQVEEAVSKRDQAELQVTQTQRLAEQQIRQFYQTFVGDRDQYEGYLKATELAENNFKVEKRDYRRGLVTNLDVLQALITFEESKRSQDKSAFAMSQDFEDVESAAGYRPNLPAGFYE